MRPPNSVPGPYIVSEWRWLMLARIGWWILALLSVTFFLWGIPERVLETRLFWLITDPPPPAVVRQGLADLNISPKLFTGYGVGLYIVRVAVFYLTAALLFRRKSNERMALLVSYFLLALPVGDVDPPVLQKMAADEPVRAAIGLVVEAFAFTMALWLFFLFPDGRFRPRWTRLVAAVWLLGGIGTLFLPGSPIDMASWPPLLSAGFVPACAALGIFAQAWRYQRVSEPIERNQSKWFALGLTIVIVEFAITTVVDGYMPILKLPAAWPAASAERVVLTDLILYTTHNLAFFALPVTLAIAVLRHRLWDIDHIINRALVYSCVTISLLTVYLATVFVLSALARAVSGGSSQLVVAASTLAVAAIFRPLLARIQSVVDRRFYRRKYDASRTLERFSARLRDDVDIGGLTEDLQEVVHQTMRPTHVSLWLRPQAWSLAPGEKHER